MRSTAAFWPGPVFRKDRDTETWVANRLLYEADEGMRNFYKAKSNQTRRRGRGHRRSGGNKQAFHKFFNQRPSTER